MRVWLVLISTAVTMEALARGELSACSVVLVLLQPPANSHTIILACALRPEAMKKEGRPS